MPPIEPLALRHSWPLFDPGVRFEGGILHGGSPQTDGADAARWLAARGIGYWTCDLADARITWSAPVYDLFGLPRDAIVSRTDALALYAEPSRATMERLRTHAIRHGDGFTIDVELRPADGSRRWMRLVAAPVVREARVVGLHGLKQDIGTRYR